MNFTKIILCSILLCTLIVGCQWFDNPPEHQYSKQELAEDFDYLTLKLSELVPSIGQYTEQDTIQKQWQVLRESIEQPKTDLEFFPILKEAIAQVEEGHIYLSGWNDEDSHVYQRLLRDQAGTLPIQMRVLNDGLYAWQNRSHSDDSPARGSKIVSINGESADFIVEALSEKLEMDAAIKNGRYAAMDLLFRIWYYLLHDQPEQFIVESISPAGEMQTHQFSAVSIQDQNQYRIDRYGEPTSRAPLNASNFYEKEIWQDKNAMYLNVFSYHASLLLDHDVDPQQFWQSIFDELETNQLTNLVIDLRENRGGRNEFVWALLPFINQNRLSGIFSQARAYDGDDHGTKLIFNIPDIDDSKVFSHNIYALINGNTFSNASVTAMALKEFANATLIGSETASRYIGFAASSWREFNLPNTDIPVRIPFFVTEYPVADNQAKLNAGVMPDIEVYPSIDDLLSDKDVTLDTVISLLSE